MTTERTIVSVVLQRTYGNGFRRYTVTLSGNCTRYTYADDELDAYNRTMYYFKHGRWKEYSG